MDNEFNVIARGNRDVFFEDNVQRWGGDDKIRTARQLGNTNPYGVTLAQAHTSAGALDTFKPMIPEGMETPAWVRNRQRPSIQQ